MTTPKNIYNVQGILAYMKENNQEVKTRPNEINIVGIRKDSTTPNKFDDYIFVFYKNNNGSWESKMYPATTDPGTYFLNNPMQNYGTAILKAGQYKNAYQIGFHKGLYKALTQKNPMTIIRDYNRDSVLDFNNGRESEGVFGINIHRATEQGTSTNVDNWSAGCQVIADSSNFNELMNLAETHRNLYGNSFNYTLIDERAYARSFRKRIVFFLSALLIAGATFYILYYRPKLLKK